MSGRGRQLKEDVPVGSAQQPSPRLVSPGPSSSVHSAGQALLSSSRGRSATAMSAAQHAVGSGTPVKACSNRQLGSQAERSPC